MAGQAVELHELARYRAEFPVFERQIYLNTCSLGALSSRSRAWVERFLLEWQERGAPAWYDVWWSRLSELRERYAAVIGARREEVALHASVSTALAVVASALDYRHRPRVVTTALDFPTVAYQWLAKRNEGVEVEILESPDGITVPLEAFEKAVDDRTAVVATSQVYFTSGAVQDLRALAEIAHSKGAFLLVDAYQSVGQIPVDVRGEQVDFLLGGGLKWLLGGPGIAFLYVRSELLEELSPSVTGWFADRDQFRFEPRSLEFHRDARRFEQGTPSLASVHAQLGGLELLEEAGWDRVYRVTYELKEDLIACAREAGLEPKVASEPARRSSIIMIPSPDPGAAVRTLAEANIVVDARAGCVRISPFFYNYRDDYAGAIELLKRR
ncbi:MAG: putative aminotransferase YcbU [Gemmatimonadales bacterium]|nr:MAG: putative aminotransferase YcbU [Gemmatimonadales bacterium]